MHAVEEIGVVQGTDEQREIRTDICKREMAGLARWEHSQRKIKPTWVGGGWRFLLVGLKSGQPRGHEL